MVWVPFGHPCVQARVWGGTCFAAVAAGGAKGRKRWGQGLVVPMGHFFWAVAGRGAPPSPAQPRPPHSISAEVCCAGTVLIG